MAQAFNINAFRGALKGGGARPNLFDVSIGGRAGLAGLQFVCKGASLPGTDIGTVEVPYFGRTVKLPGNRTYAEWTATIINDEDFAVHSGIVKWMDDLNKTVSNVATGPIGTPLSATVDIQQRTKEGQPAFDGGVVQLINAFPSSLAGIDLAWDSNDAIEEFTVTFQYDYWQNSATEQGAGFSS